MLLKLDHIFKNFDSNFNITGTKFFIRLARDEKKIDYNNMFLKINDASVVKDIDFLEEIGTFHNLLIYLLDNCLCTKSNRFF